MEDAKPAPSATIGAPMGTPKPASTMDALLRDAMNECCPDQPKSLGDKIEEQVEAEFRNAETERKERAAAKKAIQAKLILAKKKLAKTRNAHNPRAHEALKASHQARVKLRQEIATLQAQIEDIHVEEEGAKTETKSMEK
jgi:hypothetical protein